MNMRPDDAVDDAVETVSRKLAQRMSRRGFITLLGKTALALVAGSIAEILLPVDRTVQQIAEASTNCNAGVNCGMSGYPCDCCGGTSSTCPTGTTRGSSWTRCCPVSGGCKKMWYYDCCGAAVSCSCSPCNNSNGQVWCGGAGGSYRCTLALIGTNCGPC